MQRTHDDMEDLDITVCDEDCLPYKEADDDKDDEEWDVEFGRYKKPNKRNYRRRCLYNTSAVATIVFVIGMFYWSYYVMYYNMDYDDAA